MIYREFQPSDIVRITQLASQAWPVQEHLSADEGRWRVMEPYIRIGLDWSNWTCVVCSDSGEVLGCVFGDIRGLKGSSSIHRVVRSEVRALAGTLVGRYGRFERLHSMLWNFLMTEAKLIVGRADSDSEIMLLILDERFRGKGIGKELVDRFAKAARDAGAKKMSVYTDDQASNWKFYERYGFRRAYQFYDNWSSYYGGRHSNGIRYVMDLQP